MTAAVPTPRRLQRISAGAVRNATPFGRLLRRTCRGMLGDFAERHVFGFQDGGCAIMAQALVLWSGGRLSRACAALASDPAQVQHVLAADGDLLLDSDGVGTPDDVVAKMARIELRPGCAVVPGWDPLPPSEIPWDPTESAVLAAILADALPDPTWLPWRTLR